jgi:hypothetical protein
MTQKSGEQSSHEAMQMVRKSARMGYPVVSSRGKQNEA